MIWSIGATCDKNGHDIFSEYFRELCAGKIEGREVPALIKIDCSIPVEGQVYDYLFEQKGRGKWIPWLDLIKHTTIDQNIKQLSAIIVPTLDTARYPHMLGVLMCCYGHQCINTSGPMVELFTHAIFTLMMIAVIFAHKSHPGSHDAHTAI